VLLARVRGDSGVARGIAELDQVCTLDGLAEPALEPEELSELQDAGPSQLDRRADLKPTGHLRGDPPLKRT
jgi:hypothetical protein